MDRVTDLVTTVRREVAAYVTDSPNSTMYLLENVDQQAYAAVAVPARNNTLVRVVVMAHIADDRVLIDADITDRPLYEALEQAGVSREKIVLLYEGEKTSVA